MKSTSNLLIDIDDNILSITLNNPEKHNCFGITELEEMERTLKHSESDPEVKAVVFRGAGERSFSTGANLKQFTGLNKQGVQNWIRRGQEVFKYIERYPRPTVAVIQGYALGGGLELALSCDFRIAGEDAVFGSPELRHGWLPGWGGIHRLKNIIGQARTREMIFLAEHISAGEAFRFGLINRITKKDELEKVTSEMTEKLLQLNPDAFAMAKAAISGSGTAAPTSEQEIWFDILSTLVVKGD
jgi:enoyl-CoA hydratase/carnithine racemase